MFTKKVLAIEIGIDSTMICEVEYRKKKNPKVFRTLMVETPIQTINNGYIEDMPRLAESLKGELKLAGLKNNQAVFVISSTSIVSREITIPFVKKELISKIVQEQADEYFPIDVKDYIISHNIVEYNKREKRIRLTIFAAPKSIVGQYFELASEVGLKIESLDYSGNAAYQYFKHITKNETVMTLQIEEDVTVVSIIDKGRLRLQRNLNWGSKIFTFNQSEDGSVEGSVLDESNTESSELIVSSISRVLQYYSNTENASQISKIYIAGLGAFLNDIDKLLLAEFEIYVECMKVATGVTFKGVGKSLEARRSHFINCIGATFAPADFVPYEIADYEQKKSNIKLYTLVVVAVFVLCALVAIINHSLYVSAVNAQNQLKTQIQEKSTALEAYNQYLDKQKEHEQLKVVDDTTKRNNERLNILFDEIETKFPSQAIITSMISSGDTVSLSVVVPDKKTGAKLLIILRQISCIEKTYVSQLSQSQESGGVQFTITCTFNANTATDVSTLVSKDTTPKVTEEVTTDVTKDTTPAIQGGGWKQ